MSCRLHLTASPGASTSTVWRGEDGEVRVHIAAPARDGRANAALIDFLAEQLRVSRSRVYLLRGAGSRYKVVEIDGLQLDEVLARLGLR